MPLLAGQVGEAVPLCERRQAAQPPQARFHCRHAQLTQFHPHGKDRTDMLCAHVKGCWNMQFPQDCRAYPAFCPGRACVRVQGYEAAASSQEGGQQAPGLLGGVSPNAIIQSSCSCASHADLDQCWV